MITRIRGAVSSQLSRPRGPAGRVVAALMNRGNRDLNDRAIDLLDVGHGDRVLDLGFGGGLTFPALLERGASVVGIDRAPDMVQAVAKRHAGDDRVTTLTGDVTRLPLEDATVHRVLTVNTVYFWPDLDAAAAELLRVLTPGGRLVIGIRDGAVMQQVTPDLFTLRTPQQIVGTLEAATFIDATVRSAPDGKTHLITARRP